MILIHNETVILKMFIIFYILSYTLVIDTRMF